MGEKVFKMSEAVEEEVKRRRSELAKIAIDSEESAKRLKTEHDELSARLDEEIKTRASDDADIRGRIEEFTGDKARAEEENQTVFGALQEEVRAITDHLHGMDMIMKDKFADVTGAPPPAAS